jgi:MYXO-CTERM domain-containing protein
MQRVNHFAAVAACVALGAWLGAPEVAEAQECSAGLCGTPAQSGGGGCGCGGGSILIAMTDRGETYQFADDFDGDGLEDEFDNCPFAANFAQVDADSDGHGDACDGCPSTADPAQVNLDGDDMGDACDDDLDGDELANAADNCRDVPNRAQANSDDDGDGDACDDDDDGDGLPDLQDPCRLVRNDPGTGAQLGAGACDDDVDGDGIPSNDDNCANIYNPDVDAAGAQRDADGDGDGDACDLDLDGDEIPNFADNCVAVANPAQMDYDRDGLGDGGSYGGGGESCDPRECYVVGGDAENCLNPQTAFRVGISLVREHVEPRIHTGEDLTVALFTNRLRLVHTWTARFAEVPAGSNASLVNGRGAGTTIGTTPQVANCLRLDEQRACAELNNIRFRPDAPGRYVIEVTSELAQQDALGSSVSKATLVADVTGEPLSSSGGCTAAAAPEGPEGMAAWMAALAALVAVRHRRRAA